jgi:hypothetical protein
MNNPASGVKFASPEDEVIVKPYALFPISVPANKTTGTKASSGFIKLAAATLEPAFGNFWKAEGQYAAPAPESSASEEGDADTGEEPLEG